MQIAAKSFDISGVARRLMIVSVKVAAKPFKIKIKIKIKGMARPSRTVGVKVTAKFFIFSGVARHLRTVRWEETLP